MHKVLFTMSEESPTDLLKRDSFSSAGVLISLREYLSKILINTFSVSKILFDLFDGSFFFID